MAKRDIILQFRAVGLDQIRSQVAGTIQYLQSQARSATDAGNTRGAAQIQTETAAINKAMNSVTKTLIAQSKALEDNARKQEMVRAAYRKGGGKGEPAPGFRASIGGGERRSLKQLREEEAQILDSAATEAEALYRRMAQAGRTVVEVNGEIATSGNYIKSVYSGLFLSETPFGPIDPAALMEGTTAIGKFASRLEVLKGKIRETFGELQKSNTEFALSKDIEKVNQTGQAFDALKAKLDPLVEYFNRLGEARQRAFETKAKPGALHEVAGPDGKAQVLSTKDLNAAMATTAVSIRQTRTEMEALAASSNSLRQGAEAAMRFATVFERVGSFAGAGGGFLAGVQGRIQALDKTIEQNIDTVIAFRQQIGEDFPDPVKKVFASFDQARRTIASTTKALARNREELAKAQAGGPGRVAAVQAQFGLGSQDPKAQAAIAAENQLQQERLKASVDEETRLRYEQEKAIQKGKDALAQMTQLQEVYGQDLLPIKAVWDEITKAVEEVAALSSSSLFESLGETNPEVISAVKEYNEAVKQLEATLGKYDATGKKVEGTNQAGISALRRLRQAEKDYQDVLSKRKGGFATDEEVSDKKANLGAARQAFSAFANVPEVKAGVLGVDSALQGVQSRLVEMKSTNLPQVIGADQVVGQLGTLDKTLLELATGMKRRFTASLQFMISGALIFGIQRLFKQFVQSAIDVERTFKDVQTALEFDVGSERVIRETEKIRRAVLLMANEFNVMPEQANAAAYTMVAKFRDIDAAMIATRAQIIATKVATIEQGEALRALTAVAEVYGARIDEDVRGMQRQVQQAEMYTHALDAATVIQQRFGVQLEDTLEGGARLAEVYADLGFSMEEAFAQVALVAQRTGVEGAAAADRIGRAMPSLTDPATQDALAQLSEMSDLQLGLGDFLGSEADLFWEIARQWPTLIESTQSRITEIIGGRREAPYIAAAFGTAEETIRAAEAAGNSAGAAEDRFKTLSETVSESIAGIATQFDSLAQNLAQVGFLTPMKVFLATLESVLAVVNRIVQSIGQFVDMANAIQIPFFGGAKGAGELAVSLLSVTAAMTLVGNSLSRIAKPVLALTKKQGGAQGVLPGLGPVDSNTTSLAAFMAAGRPEFVKEATKTLSVISKNALQILLVPFKYVAAGVAQLAVGFTRLGVSLGWVSRETERVVVANAANATSLNGIATAGKAAWGASRGLVMSLGKFALIAGAIAATFVAVSAGISAGSGFVAGKFRELRGETVVDEATNKLREERKKEKEATEDLISEIVGASTLRAEAAAQVRDAAVSFLGEDRSLADTSSQVFTGIFADILGDPADNLKTPAGQAHASVAATREGVLEYYRAELENIQTILERDRNLTGSERKLLLESRELLNEEIDKYLLTEEEFIQKWVDDSYVPEDRSFAEQLFVTAFGGVTVGLFNWVRNNQLWGNAAKEGTEAIADAQAAFLESFEGFDFLRDTLPTADAINRRIQQLDTGLELGDIAPTKGFEESIEIYQAAILSYEEALETAGEGSEEEQALLEALNNVRKKLAEKFLNSDQNFDLWLDEGKKISEALKEAQRKMRILNENPDIKNALDPNTIAEMMKNIFDFAIKLQEYYTAGIDAQASFAGTISKSAVGDVSAAKLSQSAAFFKLVGAINAQGGSGIDAARFTGGDDEERRRIMQEWSGSHSVIEAMVEYMDAEESLFRAGIQARQVAIRRANKSALFAGEETKTIIVQIQSLKAEIKALEDNGNKDEAFDLRIELYELYRQEAESRIADAQALAQLNAGVGDQLKAAAAEVRVAQERVRLYKRLAISQRQRNLAQAQLNEAQFAYLQVVLHYQDLLNRKGSDVTDPLIQARFDSEAAAQQVANAVGEIEKEEAANNLANATAAEQQAFYDDRLNDLSFFYDTDKLSKSGYIAALRRLQAGVDRSTHQGEEIWRDMERTINGLADEMEQGFNIPSEIRMPTLFEVRRAVQADSMGVNYQDNRQQDISVYVSDEVDLQAVFDGLGINDGNRNPAGDASITGVFT